jgi:hypothetical protein
MDFRMHGATIKIMIYVERNAKEERHEKVGPE